MSGRRWERKAKEKRMRALCSHSCATSPRRPSCPSPVCRCPLNVTAGERRQPLDRRPAGAGEAPGRTAWLPPTACPEAWLPDSLGPKPPTPSGGCPGCLGDPRKMSPSEQAHGVDMVSGDK
ncbi:hypothetical protein HJG60_009617 [Phyllostomus discolor]|uniref:Uncharacterized protein n=1 Tax=Phyllostomus discolor TaxID=89673 RepID=A0A834D6D7_9CHIR|nr:hypothetical protein HJG60_009617 [Phyllostomus discolor]